MRSIGLFVALLTILFAPIASADPVCEGDLCDRSAKLRTAYETIGEFFLSFADEGVSPYGVEYGWADATPETLSACISTCRRQFHIRLKTCDRVVNEMPPEDFLDQSFKNACYASAVEKAKDCVSIVEMRACTKGE